MKLSKHVYMHFYKTLCETLIREEFTIAPLALSKKSESYSILWNEKVDNIRLGSYFIHEAQTNQRYFYQCYLAFKELKNEKIQLDVDNNSYLKALIYLEYGYSKDPEYNLGRLNYSEKWRNFSLQDLHDCFLKRENISDPIEAHQTNGNHSGNIQQQNLSDINDLNNLRNNSNSVHLGNLIFNDIRLLSGLNKNTCFIFHHNDKYIKLPKEVLQLEAEWKKMLEEKQEKIKIQNYNVYAITNISSRPVDTDNTREFHIQTKNAKNYNRLAVSLSLDTLLPNENLTVRQKYFSGLMSNPLHIERDFLVPQFGVNLSLITSDMKLVVTKKNLLFAKTERSKLHFGLGVALKSELETPEAIDIVKFTKDRLHKNYLIEETEIEELVFYGVYFSTVQCSYETQGYVKLKASFEELQRALLLSDMRERYDRLIALPFELEKIKGFLADASNPIINQYALFGALISLNLLKGVSINAISRAFTGEEWSAFSQKIAEDKIEFSLDDLRRM